MMITGPRMQPLHFGMQSKSTRPKVAGLAALAAAAAFALPSSAKAEETNIEENGKVWATFTQPAGKSPYLNIVQKDCFEAGGEVYGPRTIRNASGETLPYDAYVCTPRKEGRHLDPEKLIKDPEARELMLASYGPFLDKCLYIFPQDPKIPAPKIRIRKRHSSV